MSPQTGFYELNPIPRITLRKRSYGRENRDFPVYLVTWTLHALLNVPRLLVANILYVVVLSGNTRSTPLASTAPMP